MGVRFGGASDTEFLPLNALDTILYSEIKILSLILSNDTIKIYVDEIAIRANAHTN
jgi:hypothetical protein